MIFGDLLTQAQNMLRPGATASTVVSNNMLVWTNQLILRPLYKLRRWHWLNQKQVITTNAGTPTYQLVTGTASLLYLVNASYGGSDLLVPPIQQAEAFYTGSGPPEGVALIPGNPVQTVQVFPTPDSGGPYAIQTDYTSPLADLALTTDHNFVTDEFSFLVLAGMVMVGALSFQEDTLFNTWREIYITQVRAIAVYDHEVRRGGTMPEPLEPYIPVMSALAPQRPQPVLAGA